MKLFFAYIRAECYLLFKGMWRGECLYTEADFKGNTTLVAAATGNIYNNTIKIEKVFYSDNGNLY